MKIKQLFFILSCCGVLLSCASVSAVPPSSGDWESVVQETKRLWERTYRGRDIMKSIDGGYNEMMSNLKDIELIEEGVMKKIRNKDCIVAMYTMQHLQSQLKKYPTKKRVLEVSIDKIKKEANSCKY